MYWNRVSHDIFDIDSVGLDSPLRYGVFYMEVWAFAGVASTAIYCVGGWLITRPARLQLDRRSRSDMGDEPADAREPPS